MPRSAFDVAQAQGEPEVEPGRLMDDLGREAIPGIADVVHPGGSHSARGTATLETT